jgi:transposase-like protein
MTKKNQPVEKPEACPFCGHTDLAPSPSGKHYLCRKCGRIVLLPTQLPARRRAKTKPTC